MKQQPRMREKRPRQIVGFSLSPDLASQVKIEAAARGLSLRDLFSELWTLYTAKRAKRVYEMPVNLSRV
jgi:hypothetical protein